MKLIYLIIVLFYSLVSNSMLAADDKIINLYNWSGYLPDEVIAIFTKETGIKVNYVSFDSNETMYSKLKAAPHSEYDIIVPSNYFVDRMIHEGMLLPIDKSKLTHLKFLDPFFLNQAFDPENHYSIPYLWGTTGIAVNKRYIADYNDIESWKDLWKPQYKNQLMILNDSREVFSMVLLSLGYKINDRHSNHLKQVYDALLKLLPNIKLFNIDAVANNYIDEDATMGLAWNGDAYLASQQNPNIIYKYPKEGFVIWIDSFAIPKYAPHVENSYRFINFLLRPDIAKIITTTVGFSTPNEAAYQLLPNEIKNNPTLYPSKKILERGQYQAYVGESTAIYEKYWQLLKTR